MADANGRNAFHTSVESGKAKALRSLLRRVRPAELLNRVDVSGDTPLHIAAKRSRIHCALLLLNDRCVDPCVRDQHGHTARSLVEMKLLTRDMDTYEMYLWKRAGSSSCRRSPHTRALARLRRHRHRRVHSGHRRPHVGQGCDLRVVSLP
ncbi:unnamed protein product [Urochloa humidicola]